MFIKELVLVLGRALCGQARQLENPHRRLHREQPVGRRGLRLEGSGSLVRMFRGMSGAGLMKDWEVG